MNTWNAKKEEVEHKYVLIDAANHRLGRVATHVANIIRGKNKPTYTPNVDTGDFVVIINADKIEMTGTKWEDKSYYSHSRFFGSLKEKSAAQMKQDDPEFIIREAVRGMLPTNKMSRHLINKVKIYRGVEHPHSAQKPEIYNINQG